MTRKIINPDGMFPVELIDPRDATSAYWANLQSRLDEQMDCAKALAAIERDAKQRQQSQDNTIRKYSEIVVAAIEEICRFIDAGNARSAVAIALTVGRLDERMVAIEVFNNKVSHSTQSRRAAPKASAKKSEKAHKDYERINAAVEEAIKRRGKRRQPSLTTIRHRVADSLGFKYSKVLDAQRGGRKK